MTEMEKCPICEAFLEAGVVLCGCGYDFVKKEITDWEKIKRYIERIGIEKGWRSEVFVKSAIHEIQVEKYGSSPPGPGHRRGWRIKDTANRLNREYTAIYEDIALAKAFGKWTDLKGYAKKTGAKNELKRRKRCEINDGGLFYWDLSKTFEIESDLRKHIVTKWDKTPFADRWDFEKEEFDTGDGNIIDILARGKQGLDWLVVELKRNRSSDETLGQLLRYMGWIKTEKAHQNEKVFGAIVSGYPPDPGLRLGVSVCSAINVSLYAYSINDKSGDVRFYDHKEIEILISLCKLPSEQLDVKRVAGRTTATN